MEMKTSMQVDVLVIGAGPAGLTAAAVSKFATLYLLVVKFIVPEVPICTKKLYSGLSLISLSLWAV